VYISQETPEQARARLQKVIALAEVVFFDGTFAFEELPARDFPRRAKSQALALVRDDEAWSQLVPSQDPAKELFSVVGFHFANGVDNSGFVGWLATHLKETLGTGVFVVCGHNSRRGGIFDYWGCPARLGKDVRERINNLRAQSG